MSQALRKLTAVVARSNTCLVFINQIREKIGVMFGSPETTPGGRALKFYSSVRVDVRRISTIKEGENTIGMRMKAKVVKNKIAPPFRVAEFDMLSSRGISYEGDLLDMAVEDKIVQKSGAWFSYGETRLGQGREKARQFFEEDPILTAEIRQKILAARNVAVPASEPESDGEPAEE
jgi:recombination protein RecA